MIKKRVNAKENKFEVVFPPEGKIEKLANKLNKFPPLDFRTMLEEARSKNSGMSLDDTFKEIVSRRANKQIADVFAALGLDQGDDGVTILAGRRVSLHLMVQPGVAAIMLSDDELADQGMLSRCLVTARDSHAGRRFYREPACDRGRRKELEH